jgi:hypothetical protein
MQGDDILKAELKQAVAGAQAVNPGFILVNRQVATAFLFCS